MEKWCKKLILVTMRWLSKVYSLKMRDHLQYYNGVMYTQWIRNFMGNISGNVIILKPCYLQGGGKNINIGQGTIIQHNCILGCWKKYENQMYNPEITIGDNCRIGAYCHITAINRVKIGNGILTGRYVYIGDNAHGGLSVEESRIPPYKRKLKSKGDVVIGNNVWIGDKVTILSGVHVGNNVIIAANACVTRDVPDNCMVAGVPAKILKEI